MTQSIKNKHRGMPSFLRKTLQILQDTSNSHIACWAPDGKGFSILNEQAFSQHILPRYFKHSNYSSFVRQLNMYNFHKIRDGGSESYFYHELFLRDNLEEIYEIKRKPERKKRKSREGSEEELSKTNLRSKDQITKVTEEPKESYQYLAAARNYDELSIEEGVQEPLLIQPALGTRQLMCPSRGNIYLMMQHNQPTSVYSLTHLIR